MSTVFSLGIMTGTSCDGADGALLAFRPEGAGKGRSWAERLVFTRSRRFPEALRQDLRTAQRGKLDIPHTARLAREYSEWLGNFARSCLKDAKVSVKNVVVAVHGQTVWHEPRSHFSVQLLDPAIVAFRSGCTVTAAFRQPDLARAGHGAPLVGYYHWLKSTSLRRYAKALPFAIHNIGGIANLTYVAPDLKRVVAFDTGPGNALIDLAMTRLTAGRMLYDRDGKVAETHLKSVNWKAIHELGRLPYFKAAPPKSTGRELFDERFLDMLPGQGPSLVANATAFTAHTMAKAYADFILARDNELNGIFIAGGGARNPTLLRLFSRELARLSQEEIPVSVLPSSFAPPQYLEAMAFGRLGLEALQGRPVSLAQITGASENAFGAGIFPGKNFASLLKLLDMA